MTPSERGQCLLTARMLEGAEKIDWLSTGLTILAAAALVFGAGSAMPSALALVLGLVAKFYGVRVALDRALFADLAAETVDLEALDEAMVAMNIKGKGGVTRSITDRCRGAQRLIVILGALTIAQALAIGVSALLPVA
jgi:hypothetical protein